MSAVTTDRPTRSESRLVEFRQSLSPNEWKRAGGMFGFVALLHIVGFTLLIIAASGHYAP